MQKKTYTEISWYSQERREVPWLECNSTIWTIARFEEASAGSQAMEEMPREFKEDLCHGRDIYINKEPFQLLPRTPLCAIGMVNFIGKASCHEWKHPCGSSSVINQNIKPVETPPYSYLYPLFFHAWLSNWEQRVYCRKGKKNNYTLSEVNITLVMEMAPPTPYCQ